MRHDMCQCQWYEMCHVTVSHVSLSLSGQNQIENQDHSYSPPNPPQTSSNDWITPSLPLQRVVTRRVFPWADFWKTDVIWLGYAASSTFLAQLFMHGNFPFKGSAEESSSSPPRTCQLYNREKLCGTGTWNDDPGQVSFKGEWTEWKWTNNFSKKYRKTSKTK